MENRLDYPNAIHPEKLEKLKYSGSRLSEVQEPPPRKRRGDYDVPQVIKKRYTSKNLDKKG